MQTFSRSIFALGTALALVVMEMAPRPAVAQISAQEARPLVVIRFNQARVYYDQQLYSAISQAVAAKPDVMFDVVSNAPTTGNQTIDAQWVATASRNTQAVVASMQKLGVPLSRMRITGQTQPDLRFDETQIFVR